MEGTTLILGKGRQAQQAARELAAKGAHVVLAAPGAGDIRPAADDGIESIALGDAFELSGSVGRFQLTTSLNGETETRSVAAIVLADEGNLVSKVGCYIPGDAAGVLTLSQLTALLDGAEGGAALFSSAEAVAFVNGVATESHPVTAGQAMRSALRLQQDYGVKTYILTGNLKVGGDGLEALYRQAKQAGAVFMKFTGAQPAFEALEGGGFRITYLDEVLQESFALTVDRLVVDETVQPSAFTLRVARQLGLESGPDGFAQSDNVHRAVVATNRRGVFVAGGSRAVLDEGERRADAVVAGLGVAALYRAPASIVAQLPVIDSGHCVRCLTCLRSCPYGAVFVDARVTIDPAACQQCGICLAECPRGAISITAPEGGAVADRIPVVMDGSGRGDFAPAITAFCCQRSAVAAQELAHAMGLILPDKLQTVAVPCAGGVSTEHLLTALANGADGVLVLTCHQGNCHSERGNTRAHARADQVSLRLAQMGLDPRRLQYATLAANMGFEFAEQANRFAGTLADLGPVRQKQ